MKTITEQFLDRTSAYAPNLAGAVIALVLGLVTAWVLSAIARRAFGRTHLDERIAGWVRGSADSRGFDSARWLARGVFWAVTLVALLVFFQILGFTPISAPITRAFELTVGFAPRLLAAGALVALAFIVASFLRLAVMRALTALRVDERVSRRASLDADTTDPDATLPAPPRISSALSQVTYWLTWLLFLPGILSALALEGALGPVEAMVQSILGALPNIATAALVIAAAYFVGRIVAELAANALEALGVDRLARRLGLDKLGVDAQGRDKEGLGRAASQAATAGATRAPSFVVSRMVGTAVHVLIVLFASMEAFDLIAFEQLSSMMRDVISLFGHVALGVVVFFAGVGLAGVAGRAIRASGVQGANLLAVASRTSILVLAGAMALRQMGIANEIISLAFGLTLGGVAAAIAIAFGFGGREVAGRELERWIQSARAKAAPAARAGAEPAIHTH